MAGEFVHAKAGEADRVELTDEDIAQLRGRDLVLLHNHPSGGGLTPADFGIGCLLGLREIIAFAPRYRYRLARTSGDWPDAERILRDVRQAALEVRRAFDARIAAGTLLPGDASLAYWHEVWRRVTRRSADLRYTREVR
ncbi:MAG TPA: hypothetical protein VFN74_02880 [Chloroflexota bacterium]|nr:hypothetical protein [Chloroflexota bacterium]